MKETAVEYLVNTLTKREYISDNDPLKEVIEQAKEMEEKLQLELVHKFVFDHTYNYRGNKTLYEYVDEWYEEYKRIEEKHKNK